MISVTLNDYEHVLVLYNIHYIICHIFYSNSKHYQYFYLLLFVRGEKTNTDVVNINTNTETVIY